MKRLTGSFPGITYREVDGGHLEIVPEFPAFLYEQRYSHLRFYDGMLINTIDHESTVNELLLSKGRSEGAAFIAFFDMRRIYCRGDVLDMIVDMCHDFEGNYDVTPLNL